MNEMDDDDESWDPKETVKHSETWPKCCGSCHCQKDLGDPMIDSSKRISLNENITPPLVVRTQEKIISHATRILVCWEVLGDGEKRRRYDNQKASKVKTQELISLEGG